MQPDRKVIDIKTREPHVAASTDTMAADMHKFGHHLFYEYGASVAIIAAPPGEEAKAFRLGCAPRLMDELAELWSILDAHTKPENDDGA